MRSYSEVMSKRSTSTHGPSAPTVLLVPHAGRRWRYVGHDDALLWLSDVEYAYAAGFTPDGILKRELEGVALDHVMRMGERYVGLAATAPRAKNGAIIDLGSGRVSEATDAPPLPCGASHALVPRRTPKGRTVAGVSSYEVLRLGAKRVARTTVDFPVDSPRVAVGDRLFVAPFEADALLVFSLESGEVKSVPLDGRTLPPYSVLCADGGDAVLFAALARTPDGERWSLLRCDPSSDRVEVVATLPDGETVTAIAQVGRAIFVLASDGLRRLDGKAPFVPELDGHGLANDDNLWVFEADDRRLVVGDAKGARFALASGDFLLYARHVALGQLLIERSDGIAFVPIASLSPSCGELPLRALDVATQDVENEDAVVVDHSSNLLRVRTAWAPLLELRTGPTGRAKGDKVTLELVGENVVAVTWQANGSRMRARVGEALPLDRPFCRTEAFEPRVTKAAPAPKLLTELVALGVIDANALAPRNVRMLTRQLGRTRRNDATLLREIVQAFPPAGPRAWLLGVEAGELRHLANDLKSALPDAPLRLRIDEDDNGVAATVEVGVGRARPARVAIKDWRAPGAVAAPINDALTAAELDWALVDVDLGDEDASWLLTSRAAAEALVPRLQGR